MERFARDAGIFPGGEEPTRDCTACARLALARFGGEIRGYWSRDNPRATAGAAQGGHDFCLIGGRIIVDPWLYGYNGGSPVLDMDVPEERAKALARYGPEKRWQVAPKWPKV